MSSSKLMARQLDPVARCVLLRTIDEEILSVISTEWSHEEVRETVQQLAYLI